MSLGIVYPIGAVLQGAIANHVGVRSVTIGGAVVLLVGMVGIAAFRPAIFTALGDLPTARTEVAVLPTEELP
jgi:hypothetical protein